jgi:hypothetical protein
MPSEHTDEVRQRPPSICAPLRPLGEMQNGSYGVGVPGYGQGVALQAGLASVTVPVVSCVRWLPSTVTV